MINKIQTIKIILVTVIGISLAVAICARLDAYGPVLPFMMLVAPIPTFFQIVLPSLLPTAGLLVLSKKPQKRFTGVVLGNFLMFLFHIQSVNAVNQPVLVSMDGSTRPVPQETVTTLFWATMTYWVAINVYAGLMRVMQAKKLKNTTLD